MYEFIQTPTGWLLCWGLPPVEMTPEFIATDVIPVESLQTAEDMESDLRLKINERHLAGKA